MAFHKDYEIGIKVLSKNIYDKVLKQKYWSIVIALIVIFVLLMLWIFVPDFEKYWFGNKERTKTEILAYIGAIGGGIILLGNLYENARRNNLAQKSNLDIRFKDAATLLGSKDTSSILAGIFALHRVAEEDSKSQDSQGYQFTISEIFCAIIRAGGKDKFIIQNIMDVLCQSKIYKIKNLSEADLSGINLTGMNLSGVYLFKTNFSGADLTGANLTDTNLKGANLTGVVLTGYVLLKRSSMKTFYRYCPGGNFVRANLSEANLSGLNLFASNFTQADLSGADLSGANLSQAILKEANLRGTILDV